MCGIFTYIGDREDAGEVVLKGLKKLEYRGYDSWGIALKRMEPPEDLHITKSIGKIGDVTEEQCEFPAARIAIGHSRWATHGGVTDQNAHPHTNEDDTIAVVHNGVIENYQDLRESLSGNAFTSETDTELIPHLISKHMDKGFSEAVRAAVNQIKGRFAVVVVHKDSNTVVAARRGSPLIIGIGEDNEYFISSDIPAFLEYTRHRRVSR